MQNQKNQNIASKPEDREIYTSIIDLRKQEEVIQQSQEAEEICERNMKLFNIELTKKKKISY